MRIPVPLWVLALFTMLLVSGCMQQKAPVNITISDLSQNQSIFANQSHTTNQSITGNQSTPANSSSIPLASGNITSTTNISENNLPSNSSNANPSPTNETIAGIFFGNGKFVLVLDDISIAGTSSPCGIFSIRYSENASIVPDSNFLGCPPDSHYWRSPENETFRIRIEKIAAGYTKESRWAQVSIFG